MQTLFKYEILSRKIIELIVTQFCGHKFFYFVQNIHSGGRLLIINIIYNCNIQFLICYINNIYNLIFTNITKVAFFIKTGFSLDMC